MSTSTGVPAADTTRKAPAEIGFWCGVGAFTASAAFVVVQILQLLGVLRFPLDEILIYGTSLCIVIPFTLEILSLHYVTPTERQFWTHASLIFTIIYAVFVSANYVVQLATVIPAKLTQAIDAIRVLEQTPHSLFWDYDAVGYISMGLAAAFAIPAVGRTGLERWVRVSLIAHALVTPLITVVYFYPTYSHTLLLMGFPWGITAPLFMLLLALMLRSRSASSDRGD